MNSSREIQEMSTRDFVRSKYLVPGANEPKRELAVKREQPVLGRESSDCKSGGAGEEPWTLEHISACDQNEHLGVRGHFSCGFPGTRHSMRDTVGDL